MNDRWSGWEVQIDRCSLVIDPNNPAKQYGRRPVPIDILEGYTPLADVKHKNHSSAMHVRSLSFR